VPQQSFLIPLSLQLQAREGRAVVMFTHIHKSGGSTICSFAEKRGMSVNMINNCNVGNKTEQVHFALVSGTIIKLNPIRYKRDLLMRVA
jgi:hypothetical protein